MEKVYVVKFLIGDLLHTGAPTDAEFCDNPEEHAVGETGPWDEIVDMDRIAEAHEVEGGNYAFQDIGPVIPKEMTVETIRKMIRELETWVDLVMLEDGKAVRS